MKNFPNSVRRRLFNIAKEQNVEFSNLLIRYAIERLLYRLSISDFANQFLLKGAMLLAVWSEKPYRPTLDVDLLSLGDIPPPSTIEDVFQKIISLPCIEDGIEFRNSKPNLGPIKVADKIHGFRITFNCELAKAIIPIQIDIGFGDAVVPGPTQISYPTILQMPVPQLLSYPRETVVAEKFHAMVELGIANSRMKDYADLFFLASTFNFEGNILTRAFKETFGLRELALPAAVPLSLTEDFYLREEKMRQWSAFLKRSKLSDQDFEFPAVCTLLTDFLLPPAAAAANSINFERRWIPGKGWT